jgi:oxygen-dependent protoporphyrinogen oxidase
MRRAIVIGGGVAGLAAAHEILGRSARVVGGLEVVCLEAADRPGGNIRTERAGGYTLEWGPNGFLDNVPATLDLARRLGLSDRLLPADAASERRFLYRAGRLRLLPGGPLSFLFSDVLTWPGKLRVLGEPFGPRPPAEGDESVFDFAARRIGREAARVLVDAMVTGVYAGDSTRLSLKATFPKMWRMEREHGSLTRAMLAKRKAARAAGKVTGGGGAAGAKAGGPAGPGGHLTSFRDGLDEIIGALARALGPSLRLGSPAAGIRKDGAGYRVEVRGSGEIEGDAVVLAFPSWSAAEVVAPLDPELSGHLAGIPSASLAVVHLGFDAGRIGGAPRGFGFLVPRGEGPRILGTIWASSVFPGRAPAGKVLLTTMVGGARDPEAVGLDEAALLEIVRGDLRRTMGIEAEPEFARIFRHPRGIPQYPVGHPQRLEAIEGRLAGHPGLFVSGNSYRGISVNLCVDEALRVAEAVLEHLSGLRGSRARARISPSSS